MELNSTADDRSAGKSGRKLRCKDCRFYHRLPKEKHTWQAYGYCEIGKAEADRIGMRIPYVPACKKFEAKDENVYLHESHKR